MRDVYKIPYVKCLNITQLLVTKLPATAKFIIRILLIIVSAMTINANANNSLVADYAKQMNVAIKTKNTDDVASLIASDAIISVKRYNVAATMDKAEYLQQLQNNWNMPSYSHSLAITNVLELGKKTQANMRFTETFVKSNVSIKQVTEAKVTFEFYNKNIKLSKLVAKVVIE